MRYTSEIGAPARADNLGTLTTLAAAYGLQLENWYGVRIAVDPDELDPAPPSGPRQLAALLDVEERLGATDPYRQLGQLAHLILRKASTHRPKQLTTPFDLPVRSAGGGHPRKNGEALFSWRDP
jgi:hypothetical protein